MTSNGAQRAVEKSVATKADATTDVVPESGLKPSVTSSEGKSVESSALDEPSPVAETSPAEAAPTAEPAPAEEAAKTEAPPIAEPARTAEPAPTEEAAKTEAAPVAEPAPSAESASAQEPAPEEAAKTEALPSAESAPAQEAEKSEAAPVAQAAPIAESAPSAEAAALIETAEKSEPSAKAAEAPRSEGWSVAQGAVSTPPARIESPAALSSLPVPAVEIADEWSTHPTFWSTRPNRAWMLAGGSAIVIAFLVGALTGRLVQPERSPEFVIAASAPVSESKQAAQTPEAVPVAPVVPSSAPPSVAPSPAKRVPLAFNAKAAKAAIDGATPHLKGCKRPGDPVGPATVMVTFAPAGRVSNVSVASPAYAGTRTGECIVERLRDLRIPEFSGAAVTVKRSVTVR